MSFHSIDQALAEGNGLGAMRLVRDAQRGAPTCPLLGVRLLEACLLANQLMCAAHGARTVLRYGTEDGNEESDDTTLCRFVGSAKAFGARASRLRLCPISSRCARIANRSSASEPEIPEASAVALRDDGQLWSAEHLVGTVKDHLAHDDQWRSSSVSAAEEEPEDVLTMRRELNHATLHHVQGNHEIAADLYRKAIGLGSRNGGSRDGTLLSTSVLTAHAYSNLGWLQMPTSKPRARASFEAALALAPAAEEASERWLSLATLHWLHAQPKLARHSVRKSLALNVTRPFAHALASELHTLRHDYGAAAAAAARADALQMAASPQLPRCARWSSLIARLPVLWGEPSARPQHHARGTSHGPSRRYRELLLGCSRSHRKLTGGGWHDGAEHRAAPPSRDAAAEGTGHHAVAPWRLLDADASLDEVHWCEPLTTSSYATTAVTPSSAACNGVREVMDELWRVLVPGGLLQMRPERAACVPVSVAVTDALSAEQTVMMRFEPLNLERSLAQVSEPQQETEESRSSLSDVAFRRS